MRTGRLEHRWTFSVPSVTLKQLHVEGFRTSLDGDDFRFEYSSDGTVFTPVAMASLPTTDEDRDLIAALPTGLAGIVTIRVVDTDRSPGQIGQDTVGIDEIFIRSAP